MKSGIYSSVLDTAYIEGFFAKILSPFRIPYFDVHLGTKSKALPSKSKIFFSSYKFQIKLLLRCCEKEFQFSTLSRSAKRRFTCMDKNLLTILKTKPFSICCAINNMMATMKFKMQQYQQL